MIIQSLRDLVAGKTLVHIHPDQTVRDASTMLDRHGIGALAVMADGRLTGILSERDIIRRAIARGRPVDALRVAEIMTRDVITTEAGDSLCAALTLMRKHAIRHLVVTDQGRPVGMVSIRDIPASYRLLQERFQMASRGALSDA